MTLKSFAICLFIYVPAICFWVAIISVIWGEVSAGRRLKKDLEKARKVA